MLDVDVGAGGVGEADVAVDDDFFGAGGGAVDAELVGGGAVVEGAGAGELGDFAMGGEEHVELGGVLHGAVEEGGVDGGIAIIGEHEDSGGAHAVDACEFLALAAFGDATGSVDGDAGVFCSRGKDGGDGCTGVDGGGGIWHHDDAGDAAVDGCFGACGDIFLLLLAGFAEVDVGIEEGGEEDLVLAVDDLGVGWGADAGGDFFDDAVDDEDVGGEEAWGGFGGDAGVLEEEVHGADAKFQISTFNSQTSIKTGVVQALLGWVQRKSADNRGGCLPIVFLWGELLCFLGR